MDNGNTIAPCELVGRAAFFFMVKTLVCLPILPDLERLSVAIVIVIVTDIFIATVVDMLCTCIEDRGLVDRCMGAGNAF